MTTQQTTILNARGIHVRPSGVIAKALSGYPGSVCVAISDGEPQPITAMPLSILSLGLACGDRIAVSVDGPDEGHLCNELCSLFSTRFDFT